ncbi:MAG: cell division protein FtsA [Alistipes sp.]|nr:cell division protein FtsA [Alistipes sp.]MBR6663027.1 cell division protein FtsA [Alistipes sp.]
MENKSYIVAVDVGSSEVVVAVGSYGEGGVVNIECVVAEPTEGVTAGLVDNNQIVASALIKARQAAEQQVGVAITDAYVSISGKFVRCARYTDHVFVEDVENCISQRDVNALRERMENVKAADGEIIMDFFPINYKSDMGVEMKNPVGSYSKQLSSTYNFILCERSAKDRFRRVFLDAGIKIRGMYASAAVVAESVVNSDEMQEGVAVVDIGSGVTDVAIYYGGVLNYIASIPIGGSAVNNDIRLFNGYIPPKTVESLKRRYGSAVVSLTPDELIQVRKGNRAIKPIARLNLAAVIEARMTDIAEYVWNEIREAGFAKKLSAGIVLTGGVADLKNVADLFNRVTGQETRVACAEIGVATESLEKVSSPNYTLAVSMLLRGAKVGACPVGVLHTPAQPVQPVERETIVQQPRQSASVGAGVAGMAGAAGAAAQPRSVNDSFGTQPTDERAAQSVTQRVATPKLSTPDVDDYDDDDDDFEDDVKSGGGFFGKIKGWFDDAFRNPDEEEDEM